MDFTHPVFPGPANKKKKKKDAVGPRAGGELAHSALQVDNKGVCP